MEDKITSKISDGAKKAVKELIKEKDNSLAERIDKLEAEIAALQAAFLDVLKRVPPPKLTYAEVQEIIKEAPYATFVVLDSFQSYMGKLERGRKFRADQMLSIPDLVQRGLALGRLS